MSSSHLTWPDVRLSADEVARIISRLEERRDKKHEDVEPDIRAWKRVKP